MSTRKILHAADIHLDSPLQKLANYHDAPTELIRGATRRALENMTRFAITQEVDLVVIAGDLYDGDWKEQNTGLFFVSQATELVRAGIPIVVIRGNHDAANVMTSSLPLPKNPDGSEIMMAADRVDTRVFEEIGVVVHGRSFGRREEAEGMVQQYPAAHRGLFNLGLMHTSLSGNSTSHSRYAPCTPAQLTEKEYDYWALGHIHKRGEHGLDGGAPIVFSGNVQGRHIRESGPRGCVLVSVDSKEQTQREFHPLDVVRWESCQLDATHLDHVDDLQDMYQRWLCESLSQIGDRALVTRIVLTGSTDLHRQLHHESRVIEDALRSITVSNGDQRTWLEKLKIQTRDATSRDQQDDVDGPLHSLNAVISELSASDGRVDSIQRELAPLLKKLPTEMVSEDMNVASAEWINELIEASSADLIQRLHGQEASE